MKKNLTKIGLQGYKYTVSYYDLTTEEGTDSATLTYKDISTPDTHTVANVYSGIIDDYLELLSQTDGVEVISYGKYGRGGIDGDIVYVTWDEEVEEYQGCYSTLEHTELIALYVHIDGQMVVIPYSDDPVTAVTIDLEDWDI